MQEKIHHLTLLPEKERNMASPLVSLKPYYNQSSKSTLTSHLNSSSSSCKLIKSSSQNLIIQSNIIISSTRRRKVTIATVSSLLLLAKEAIFRPEIGSCFDLRMTVPDQTIEEAEMGIKTHVQDLLDVKELIELESWREAQKALRKSSSYLKQDIYTIIQAKPGSQRPLLRKLYSELFNNVTKLDYAARSKDADIVRKCYQNIVVALDDIISRL